MFQNRFLLFQFFTSQQFMKYFRVYEFKQMTKIFQENYLKPLIYKRKILNNLIID